MGLHSKESSLVDGTIVDVLVFSERAAAGAPVVLHDLGSVNVASGTWDGYSSTLVTTAGVTGISLLIEVVCGELFHRMARFSLTISLLK